MVPNKPGTDWIAQVPLCPADKVKIIGGNASRLLKIDARATSEPAAQKA